MSTKLSITFNVDGGTSTMSYNYADPEAEASDIQAAATALVTNGIIFTKPPMSIKTIKLVTTTEQVIPNPA